MCGIAGILNFEDNPVNQKSLFKMISIINHRGPDDQGVVLFDTSSIDRKAIFESKEPFPREENSHNYRVGLGHRRLSIIDLSERGHQPMSNIDGSMWIVYNGEVYNYVELKVELSNKGYNFKSDTDTEVILYAYQEWGVNCLNRFNGMWSFAIWDCKKRELFCARDRFGVKPFYYYYDNDTFIFASEIKQILECENYRRAINEKIIYDYLVIGLLDHTNETFFKNIKQLRGGEYAIVDIYEKTFKINKFYSLSNISLTAPNKSDYYDEFKELFLDSVNLRLRSDVPVGSCLSGGLDSSAVVSTGSMLLKKKNNGVFNTFTACWIDERINERRFAEMVINSSGANSNFVYPTSNELIQDLSRLVWHQEEPFGSLSMFAQWSVMKAARLNNVPVLLDGQGGDEVCLGYGRYYAWFLMELLKQAKLSKFFREFLKSSENSKLSMTEVALYYFYFNFNRIRASLLKRKVKTFFLKDYLDSHNLLDRLGVYKGINSINNLQINEIHSIELPHLLKYADRNSMAFSIESRLPFLDYRLVEFSLKVPSEYKIRDGWSKNLIREGMKGIIPEEIRLRKNKLGFDVPQSDLVQSILPYVIRNLNKGSILENYCDINVLLDKMKQKDLGNLTIWKALCLDLWYREFFTHEKYID